MSLRSGKLPSLGSEDEFFDHKGISMPYSVEEDCGELFRATDLSLAKILPDLNPFDINIRKRK
jgi:hypothetical protein